MALFMNNMIKNKVIQIIRENLLEKLNNGEFNQLIDILCNFIENIYILCHIGHPIEFEEQLFTNGGMDIIGLFLLLLPYIKTASLKRLQQIVYLNELYVTKETSVDISQHAPAYIFTNVQYNRCERNPIREIPFDMIHVTQNYTLLNMTLQTIANRMYINWVNTYPVPITKIDNKIDSLPVYVDTVNEFTAHRITEWNLNTPPPKHLYVGTIYETIRHQLFESIYKIKWLLYDYDVNTGTIGEIDRANNQVMNIIPVIEFLMPVNLNRFGNTLNLTNCFDGVFWENLSDAQADTFTNDWNMFKSRMNVAGNKLQYASLLRAITISFSINYKNKFAINGYIPVKFKENRKTGIITKIHDDVASLNSIPANDIYEFLRDTFIQFKSTIYYKLMINEMQFDKLNTLLIPLKNLKLMLKNIYNFAKSFSHMTVNAHFIKLPEKWENMNNVEKAEIFRRLNDELYTNWFNISRNLQRIYNVTPGEITQFNLKLHKVIHEKLIKLVFYALINNGTLTEFILKEKQQLTEYNDCYYYLNGKKFKDVIFHNERDNFTEISYIEYNETKTPGTWHNFYAMNWVSQIGFFHKYLNNRIIFVTGGTGVGKSTQIPKLLLYSLKMVDNKATGKVICSQPRQKPTVDNAVSISVELGVSIKKDNKNTDDDYVQENINVQFQYKGKSHPKKLPNINERIDKIHTKEILPYPILKIVTDGLLKNYVNDPTFKRKFLDKTIACQEDWKYTSSNMYDIVIVDESHEHNPNMDLILTLMKRILYYNNDCKLVIISATMEQDEPTYRRYYRDINDNLMYPINHNLRRLQLDRINVDRRLDISIPGMTTRYKIDRTYLDVTPSINDKNLDENNNKLIVEILQKILHRGTANDILVFKSGQNVITKCIKMINDSNMIPDDAIALPLYGNLSEDVKDFIGKIDQNRTRIKMNKNDASNIETVNDLLTGNNKYNNFIIVATNIAEASITINTLTDVIDDGIQKIRRFEPELNGPIDEISWIAESNRMQREGRVGRRGEGFVHYLYKEGFLTGIKNKFKICLADMSPTLFELIRPINDREIFNNSTDPNYAILNNVNYDKTKFSDDLNGMIEIQYTSHGNFYKYFGNNTQYDYNNTEFLGSQYMHGFSSRHIVDDDGKFYIVSPNELSLERNILGNITNNITENRIRMLMNILVEKFLLLENKATYVKTKYGEEIWNIYNALFVGLFTEDIINYTILCVFAYFLGCFNEIIKIIIAMDLKTDIIQQNLLEEKGLRNGYTKSDLLTHLKIFDKILTHGNYEQYAKILTGDELLKKLSQVESELKSKSNDVEIQKYNLNYTEEYIKDVVDNVKNNIIIKTNYGSLFTYVKTYAEITERVKSNQKCYLDKIGNYLNVNVLRSQCATKEDAITVSLLHAFGSNLVKKIMGGQYYSSIKYPNLISVKKVDEKSTFINDIFLQGYLLYLELNINEKDDKINSTISQLHYVNPKFLQYISHQTQLKKYFTDLNKTQNHDKDIILPTEILSEYERTKKDIIDSVIENNQYFEKSSMVYINIIPDYDKYIKNIVKDNTYFLANAQKGGNKRKKYKVVKL